ncbi:Hypothetical protein FKW44_012840 [Caligus rogercresseyi]|uniref:Uncharacterized protein n=1 Tax=Caligus rogercresseyi TaxID=217165 RepID=A0A7T8HK85_CALRO|nr:Hypothetical protein FKW44_012840 [Caligus rogercresseyi]
MAPEELQSPLKFKGNNQGRNRWFSAPSPLRRDLPALSPGEDLRHRGRVQGCHEHVF